MTSQVAPRVIKRTYQHYLRWYAMCRRCLNPNDRVFMYYGGEGITIDWEWHPDNPQGLANFNTWFEEQLEKPEVKVLARPQVTRIGHSSIYSPTTCSLVPPHKCIQSRRDVKLSEETVVLLRQFKKENLDMPLSDMATKFDLDVGTLYKALTGRNWASVDKIEAPLPHSLTSEISHTLLVAGVYSVPNHA
jgi:hypothetical protein